MSKSEFRCCICHQPAENPVLFLDRRVEQVSKCTHEGEQTTSINISLCETLLVYCGQECWQAHQPDLAEAMQLKATFPKFSTVTPCCRCGLPVSRTKSHVAFTIATMNLEPTKPFMTGNCLDDADFAILCPDCDAPILAEEAEQYEELDTEAEATI